MPRRKQVALIAHDSQKAKLVEWVKLNQKTLSRFNLTATGTTGFQLHQKLGLKVKRFKSGPLGGDLQIGAQIAEGKMDAVVFFWDPLAPQPHDVDVKALLRVAVLYNIPIACNLKSAEILVRWLKSPYSR